ncbi:MAG: hypothetical protein HY235_16530 [Acidobacteria bacterium]|nr:hypothetical protein [Acidobacteriota bacterium]
MTQSQLDLTTHLGFQLSLLRLSAIPGPSRPLFEELTEETRELEDLVDCVITSRRTR